MFFESSFGEASITETAKYKKNGVVVTEQVLHKISLHKTNGSIAVGADAYTESISDFSSCSYVPDTMASVSMLASEGGAPCLCVVASNEVGYTETYNNITKYGAFLGMDGLDWCASFIAWCAAQANVPASVIPQVSGAWSLSDHFTLQGNFYYSSFGGSTSPEVGDIFFLGTGTGGGVTHVGIVVGVTSSSIQVVDSNWGDRVCSRTISRTATDLVGYGRPAYTSSSHTYGNYQHNSTYHWGCCNNCGIAGTQEVHIFAPTGQYNELVCTICGYASGIQVNSN